MHINMKPNAVPICYDLHSHSTCSDGTLSPAKLVERAADQGVNVLALTDHDTTEGLEEAGEVARRVGLTLVPGVEISASWQGRVIHVVGLHIDPVNRALQAGLKLLRQRRTERGREIGIRLENAGIKGAFEGASRFVGGSILSRTHFARYLVASGYVADISKAFRKYLGRNKPGHVVCEWVELEQCVDWILGAGGQAVIAHPARYPVGSGVMRTFLHEFRQHGGEAIEVVTGSQKPQDRERFARFANEFGLFASSGSDFHGPEYPWRELGRLETLPAACEPIWHSWPATDERGCASGMV